MLRGSTTALAAAGAVLWGLIGPGMTVAPAAPACTISFDRGPTGGGTAWETAANWSTDRLPAATDDVCILPGQTVVHSTGTDTVLSIQSQGDLQVTGGSPEGCVELLKGAPEQRGCGLLRSVSAREQEHLSGEQG